ELSDASWYHSHVPVRSLPAHQDQVELADLLNGPGEGHGSLKVVDAVEAGVAEQHTLVRAHGERVLDRIAGTIGAERDDRDFPAASRVLEPECGLRRLGVERVHDGGDSLCG